MNRYLILKHRYNKMVMVKVWQFLHIASAAVQQLNCGDDLMNKLKIFPRHLRSAQLCPPLRDRK